MPPALVVPSLLGANAVCLWLITPSAPERFGELPQALGAHQPTGREGGHGCHCLQGRYSPPWEAGDLRGCQWSTVSPGHPGRGLEQVGLCQVLLQAPAVAGSSFLLPSLSGLAALGK